MEKGNLEWEKAREEKNHPSSNDLQKQQNFLPKADQETGPVSFTREPVMSEDEEKVNTSSVEFKQGVEAGLNSEEDTKNWKAGNELGQELKEEGETTEPVRENS